MFFKLALVAFLAAAAFVAGAPPSGGAGRERVHVVKPGETLWSIAAANGGGDPREAVWELQRRNDLRGALLRPGDRLIVP